MGFHVGVLELRERFRVFSFIQAVRSGDDKVIQSQTSPLSNDPKLSLVLLNSQHNTHRPVKLSFLAFGGSCKPTEAVGAEAADLPGNGVQRLGIDPNTLWSTYPFLDSRAQH